MYRSGPDLRLFECPVCYEYFTDPRILECEHQFCLACLRPLCEFGLISCPVCRAFTDVGGGDGEGVATLPKNRLFSELQQAILAHRPESEAREHVAANINLEHLGLSDLRVDIHQPSLLDTRLELKHGIKIPRAITAAAFDGKNDKLVLLVDDGQLPVRVYNIPDCSLFDEFGHVDVDHEHGRLIVDPKRNLYLIGGKQKDILRLTPSGHSYDKLDVTQWGHPEQAICSACNNYPSKCECDADSNFTYNTLQSMDYDDVTDVFGFLCRFETIKKGSAVGRAGFSALSRNTTYFITVLLGSSMEKIGEVHLGEADTTPLVTVSSMKRQTLILVAVRSQVHIYGRTGELHRIYQSFDALSTGEEIFLSSPSRPLVVRGGYILVCTGTTNNLIGFWRDHRQMHRKEMALPDISCKGRGFHWAYSGRHDLLATVKVNSSTECRQIDKVNIEFVKESSRERSFHSLRRQHKLERLKQISSELSLYKLVKRAESPPDTGDSMTLSITSLDTQNTESTIRVEPRPRVTVPQNNTTTISSNRQLAPSNRSDSTVCAIV